MQFRISRLTLLLLFVGFLFLFKLRHVRYSVFVKKTAPSELNSLDIYDLSQLVDCFEKIDCRKSASIRNVSTTLCYHNTTADQAVSRSILERGVWEAPIVSGFISIIQNTRCKIVFDIGAQLGQYSLFAAKIVPKVISVEPFYDSIIRLRKAAQLENLTHIITLVTNAVSNKPNEWKLLQKVDINIGGQGLLPNKDRAFEKKDVEVHNKYLVRTILMDDLVALIEPKFYHSKAIMKIDIEGFEVFAFEKASKLFDLLDIQAVFMEWLFMTKIYKNETHIIELIDFFSTRHYSAFDTENGKKLYTHSWKLWPIDVIWLRDVDIKILHANTN